MIRCFGEGISGFHTGKEGEEDSSASNHPQNLDATGSSSIDRHRCRPLSALPTKLPRPLTGNSAVLEENLNHVLRSIAFGVFRVPSGVEEGAMTDREAEVLAVRGMKPTQELTET